MVLSTNKKKKNKKPLTVNILDNKLAHAKIKSPK
jgi:hypothetical protein